MQQGRRKPFHVRHVDAHASSEAEFDTLEAADADADDRNARAIGMGLLARYVAEPTPPDVVEEEPERRYERLRVDSRVYAVPPAEKLALTDVDAEPVLLRMTFGIPDRPLMAYKVHFSSSFGDGAAYLVWGNDSPPAVGMSTYVEWDLPELSWGKDCRPARSFQPRMWIQDQLVRLVAFVEGIEFSDGDPVRFDLRLSGSLIPADIRGGQPAPGDWIELEIEPEKIELWPHN